jgi:hypothetical protein
VNQNYTNTLVTDTGQVLLDSAKQTFGVKLVNTNYSKKKKIAKGDWFIPLGDFFPFTGLI